MRDYACNKGFRRDVYARGLLTVSGIEQRQMLGRMRFALGVRRAAVTYKFQSSLTTVEGKETVYNAIMDLLAEKIATYAEIAALPVVQTGGE